MDWSGYERSGYGLEETSYDMLEDDSVLEDLDDTLEDEDPDTSLEYPKPSYSVYKRKHQLLLERMNAMNQDTEIMVYRITKMKQLLADGMKERSFLMTELDARGDNYKTIPVTNPYTEPESKKKESGGGSERKGKKAKGDKEKLRDPDLPKRPQNPFFQFCKEQRDAVSDEVFELENIHLSKKELTKRLATRWNLLNTDQKQIYNIRFEEERDGYNIKMEDYRRRKQGQMFGSYDLPANSADALNVEYNDF